MSTRPAWCALLLTVLLARGAGAAQVKALPDTVWWEPGRGLQRAHCDFRFAHDGPDTLELTDVQVEAFDTDGRLLARRFISQNGTAPAIRTIPNRELLPRSPLIVFNPFAEWDAAMPVASLRYRFIVENAARAETLQAAVAPRHFPQRADLILPLAGRVFVFDAHDALAHHRRVDFEFPPIRPMGIQHNSGRYAYDLSLVDEKGSMWRTDGKAREDWWSWGVPVRAPAAGRVVAMRDSAVDWQMGGDGLSIEAIFADPIVLMGNHVILDHGNGEYSALCHFQRGSIKVRPGERVRQGQELGRIGYSGSVFTVHLHYELRRGAPFDVDGLPSRFRGVERVLGTRREPVRDGFIETGDILQSR